MADDEEKQASGEPSLVAAIDRIRTTALWLIGAFGAIGAALTASLPFSDIGKLEGTDARFAGFGVAIAFLGVTLAIVAVSQLLLPRARTLTELQQAHDADPARARLAATPELLLPMTSLDELVQERERLNTEYAEAYAAWIADPSGDNATAVDAWADAGAVTQAALQRVIAWANYETLLADYKRAVNERVLVGLALTAAGLLLFAYNVTDTPAPSPADARGAKLENAELTNAKLAKVNLTGASLQGADLGFADLSASNLSGADLSGANLTGANLRYATLDDAELGSITWAGTTCPDGTNSDHVGGSCDAHLTVEDDD